MSFMNVDRLERAQIVLDSYLLMDNTGGVDGLGLDDVEGVVIALLSDVGRWYREQFGCDLDFQEVALWAETHAKAEEEDED